MSGVAAHVQSSEFSRRTTHAAERAFLGTSAALFVASAAITIVWCGSMSAMGGDMAMPGGWTMSMAWMRMPGRTWLGAGATFLGMWIVMMVAMMMPSLVPMLRRYRRAVGTSERRLGRLTVIAGLGYFSVWTALGVVAYPLGVALAAAEMRQPALARAVPAAVGVAVLLAGVHQLGAWKARHLRCCREMPGPGRMLPADAGAAWRHGLRLGLHCARCCAGLMAILMVVGVMDLATMALVATALTIERVAPAGERIARGFGVVAIAAGLVLLARG
jgi:predicted metal-binding membrane protein